MPSGPPLWLAAAGVGAAAGALLTLFLRRRLDLREARLARREGEFDLAVTGTGGSLWRIPLDPERPDWLPKEFELDDQMKQHLGYSSVELPSTFEAWRGLIPEEDVRRILAAQAAHMADPQFPHEVEYRVRNKAGEHRWIHSRGRVELDERGRATAFVGLHWDVTDRKRAEHALRLSEERFRLLADNIPGVIYLCLNDKRWTMLYLNDEVERVTGHSKQEFIVSGLSFADIYHPDDTAQIYSQVEQALEAREPFVLEYRIRRPDGSLRWIDEYGCGVWDDQGELTHLEGVLFDVTSRVQEQERRALIAQELDHRVKNTLATVMAVADRTLAEGGGLEDFAPTFRGRIASLAQAHEALARNEWRGAGLRNLVEVALAPYLAKDQVRVEGPEVELPTHAVASVTMALHELTTNAAKYGALSVAAGQVAVELRVGPIDADQPPDQPLGQQVELVWIESNGPPVSPPQHRGFGTRLIEQGVGYELGGAVELDYAPGGLRCTIRFELPAMPGTLKPDDG